MNLNDRVWKAFGIDRNAAKPCSCSQSLPMPETDDGTSHRIACAFCWLETPTCVTPAIALVEWNKGNRVASTKIES